MKIINYLAAKPARFFFTSAIIWFLLVCFFNSEDGSNFEWHDILVEANGMTFDLLVFGILLSSYESLREKKDKVERLHEEIDDYRGWDEKEAMFRIVGAVRRLNRMGVSKIDLSGCYLVKANLFRIQLQGANLQGANFQEADLREVNLCHSNLNGANFQKADLQWIDFQETDLQGANLQDANLTGANFQKADLRGVNFQGANLEGADFQGANLEGEQIQLPQLGMIDFAGANLQGANLEGVNFLGANLHKVIVGKHWFIKIDLLAIKGIDEIKEKYIIDEEGVLILKFSTQI